MVTTVYQFTDLLQKMMMSLSILLLQNDISHPVLTFSVLSSFKNSSLLDWINIRGRPFHHVVIKFLSLMFIILVLQIY